MPGFLLQIAEHISFQCIADGAIRPDDWHWATAGHAPLLGALGRTVSAVSLTAYLSHRDDSLLRLGSRVTQVYCALWDGYGEALIAAMPPNPENDFSMPPPPPSSQLDDTLTPNTESPPSPQLAASPWTARLDADHDHG